MEVNDKFTGIEEVARTNPLALLTLKDPTYIQVANSLLPYSTGFEIECNNYKPEQEIIRKLFTSIPKIMDVSLSREEVRFRIPRGINGLICLSIICNKLKSSFELNPMAGIHYHVDMEKEIFPTQEFINENQEWILKELDNWKYTGHYNDRTVNLCKMGWVAFRVSKSTCEFRCGDQSFDYDYIIDKMIHANSIIKRVKVLLNPEYLVPYFEDSLTTIEEVRKYFDNYPLNTTVAADALKKKYAELKKQHVQIPNGKVVTVDMAAIIKARTNKKV